MIDLAHIGVPELVRFIGYPGLFTAIFLESGVFFGFFLPGGSLLFTAGVLASAGIFNIWILVPLLTVAAILGDNAGYWFGAYVGHRLFTRNDSRFFKKQYVEQTRAFYEKYGTRTIVFARFVPIVRTFAPILAGVGEMKYSLFFRYNILGALLWASGITTAGFLLVRAIPDAEKYITYIVVGIIFVTCIPLFIEWRQHRAQKKTGSPLRRGGGPRGVIFDLDNTLAESFKPPELHVAERLHKLMAIVPVGIMSGASFDRMSKDVLPVLPAAADKTRLYLFPDTAAQCFTWEDGRWQSIYKNAFTKAEYGMIMQAVNDGLAATGIIVGAPRYGDLFLARDTQVTFAAIGIDATPEAKAAWDPDRSKRKKLKEYLDKKLNGFDVRISGRTAIDITRTGIDKAHGVRWFAEKLGTTPSEMLFVGDDLGPGGNDAMVIPTGIETKQVAGPHEVADAIDEILAAFGAR